ncbi:uncharacterized protein LOC110863342 [Folsomia candida]|uniref:uncharacterized protein LOC110863342 n=1 Tax=Folsomia candida TaxID=158441 RepID=UPI000B8FC9E2|nr:uncharacterized protein LOC110863342 [Folsomia candida]
MNFHKYATLKTSGQLVMDLGSVTTHIAALVALLKSTNVNDNPLTQFFCWFLVGTIIFQVIIAIGLFTFRQLDLNEEINHTVAKRWNIAFFVAIFIISLCEAFIGIFEKFGLEHGPSVINGTTSSI